MPEGDTIARTARTLDRVLTGRPLTRAEASRVHGHMPAVGTLVTGVEARGKHLLVHFGDGRTLRTHMRMTGSWHVYAPGERWRKQPAAARAVLEVPGAVAVCFAAPVVELVPTAGLETTGPLATLGPDLTADVADVAAAVVRARAGDQDRDVSELLLDQRVASGVGNIYRSETLFETRLAPSTPVADLSDAALRALFETARRQLRSNLDGPGPRRTVAGGLAVYRRAGRPCRVCGTVIATERRGEHARSVYWCPRCQVPPRATA